MNIWCSFHLNDDPPFGKITRINEKQDLLHGLPVSSCCFPETMEFLRQENMELNDFPSFCIPLRILEWWSTLSWHVCWRANLFTPTHSTSISLVLAVLARAEACALEIQSCSTNMDSTLRCRSAQLRTPLWKALVPQIFYPWLSHIRLTTLVVNK